ncbi:MAG: hypothetical protein WC821_00745 [archaeon]|jgi:hypothetical protein
MQKLKFAIILLSISLFLALSGCSIKDIDNAVDGAIDGNFGGGFFGESNNPPGNNPPGSNPGPGDNSGSPPSGGTDPFPIPDNGAPPSSSPPGNNPTPPDGGGISPDASAGGQMFINYVVNTDEVFVSQILGALEIAAELQLTETNPDVNKLRLRAQAYVNKVISDPNATIKELLEATQIAQYLGLEGTVAMKTVADKSYEKYQEALNDPYVSIPDLLVAMQMTQSIDWDEQRVANLNKEKLTSVLLERMQSQNLCKKQLLEISTMAKMFDMNKVITTANTLAASARTMCDKINYQEKIEDISNKTSSITTANITGNLKEYTVMGFAQENTRSYYFEDADFTWTFQETPSFSYDECIIETRTGSGTIKLQGLSDGLIYMSNKTDVEGSMNKEVIIKVLREKGDAPPSNPHACDYVTAEDLDPRTESKWINIYFEGKTDDPSSVAGTYVSPPSSDPTYIEVKTVSYVLAFSDTASTTKKW